MPVVVLPHDEPKWPRIIEILTTLKEQTTLDEVFSRLANIHGIKCNLAETPPLEDTPFGGLYDFLHEYAEEEETEQFLGVVMPTIAILALDIKRNTPVDGVKYCMKNAFKTTPFNRRFVASLIACGFLCLFPEEFKPESVTGMNFDWFFDALRELPQQHEKLRCMLQYFERMSVMYTNLSETVGFTRVFLPENRLYNKDYLLGDPRALCPLSVYSHASVPEITTGLLTASFSNTYIGGGVLDRGCSHEEIRFVTCPEMLVGLLFMANMDKTECVVISGFEQFAETEGVGEKFEYVGPCQREYERDVEGNYQTAMVAIDAHLFPHTRDGLKLQFLDKHVMRDVNKAYVGFCQPGTTGSTRNGAEWMNDERQEAARIYPVSIRAVATGNWGCGSAGGGDYQLKAVLQWVAATVAQVPELKYYTERRRDLDNLELLVQDMVADKWTVGMLCRELFAFSEQVERNKDKGFGLFNHLEQAMLKRRKKAAKPKCSIL